MIPLSVLDLCPIAVGGSAADAFRNSLALARHVEALGYRRFWLAEHHNMPGIASAATSVVIAHVAAGTSRIRLGAGGIMLPNHAPLAIAEQFGTLASLFPDRIDLGLGRAPGSDMATARALRRDPASGDEFPQQVQELQYFFAPAAPGQAVQAVPGAGLGVPLWILGSSLFGAQLAAALGLPYAFASHFAPTFLLQALEIYRSNFVPSAQLDRPYVMATVNVLAADTDEEARYHFSSQQQAFTNLLRGTPGQLPPPVDDIESYWSPSEKAGAERMLHYSFVGAPQTVAHGLRQFLAATTPDELMVTGHVHDQTVRLRSYELVAGLQLD
jgi:luciferase family oxidoreductase group 1